MNQNVKKDNFYFMKLKKNISKAGKTYYTGKFAYAIELLGFEKEDGSITLWLAPQDMDKMKQQGPQTKAPAQYTPNGNRPLPPSTLNRGPSRVQQQQQYVDHTRPPAPPQEEAPWPNDDDIPF